MWHDLRYTLRTLARHPGFFAAGVVVLALGIGVNSAIFSIVNAILFRPLPVERADELRFVYARTQRRPYVPSTIDYRQFLDLRERRDIFRDVTFVGTLRDKVRIGGSVDGLQGEMVAGNYFDLLGVRPLIGRPFTWSGDESTNAAPAAIISHALWQARFLGSPDVVGQTLELSSQRFSGSYAPWKAYTIVGVMPPGFKGVATPWEPTQIWLPYLRRNAELAEDDRQRYRGSRVPPWLTDPTRRFGLPIGRLNPGATSAQAAEMVRAHGEQVRRELGQPDAAYELTLSESRRVALPFDPRGQIVPSRLAGALLAVSGMLMLIAAANLAGIILARGIARGGELALRRTLGAGAWRLSRQLVSESLVLAFAGGALGLLFARWLVDLFVAGTPSRLVRWQITAVSLDVPIDWRVLAMTVTSCLLTGLVLGLVPLRQALAADGLARLAGQSFAATRPVRGRLRHWIVVPQICLSLVLLLVAGILVRTMIRAELQDPGYDAAPVVLVDFETPERHPAVWTAAIADRVKAERLDVVSRVLDKVSSAPGVAAASVVLTTPMLSLPLASMQGWVAAREGFRPDGRHYWASHLEVTADYFRTLQIPLLHGREFDARDRPGTTPVTIVSEDLARLMWPGQNPLGQYLAAHWPDTPQAPAWREVVGVVRNVHAPLSDGTWSPAYYVPLGQSGVPLASTIAARGPRPPNELIEALKAAVVQAVPDAVPINPRQMRDRVGEILYPRRMAAAILGLAGAIGLLLASTGLYGVVSYSVAQRVREIGVRMALGADRRDVTRLIAREGLTVAAGGIALGFVVSFAAIRLTSRLVVAMPPMDAITLCLVPALLASVVLVACYLPALRAARVDPMAVLRNL